MEKKRITMRPITLRRIIELCNLALEHNVLNENLIMKELQVSPNRSKELLFEISRMKLLNKEPEGYVANDSTKFIIDAFEKEEWHLFHQFFLKHHPFYRHFIEVLKSHLEDEKGITIDELVNEAKEKRLPLNRTTIEVLQNWCERLVILQRHLYFKRFYVVKHKKPKLDIFKATVQKAYHSLNKSPRPGLYLTYVEVPKLREEVCEQLKISRNTFDRLFKEICCEAVGKIELSGAPTITSAKRSPLGIRTMKAIKKKDVVSPKIDLDKERRGIFVGGKAYYYVAIHEKLDQ